MKKMNLNFLGLKMKMVLPLFLLFGLFVLSTNTASAQAVNSYANKVTMHVNALPDVGVVNLPTQKSVREAVNDPRLANNLKVNLEKEFGNLIVFGIDREGFSNKESIEKTYKILNVKIPAAYLDPVKQVYVDLLQ